MLGLLLIVPVSFCLFLYARLTRKNKSGLPYPPGPPAHPILGHLRIMPAKDPHETFHEWSKIYGDVMYLEVLGKPIVVLGSEQAATDLLDKRSSNYSDRPDFPIYQRIGWRDILAFLPYGQYYRKLRKMLGGPFDRGSLGAYKPIQEQETNVLLNSILKEPSALDRHVHRFSAAIIFEITYGHRVYSNEDEYFRMSEQFVHLLMDAGQPSLLDIAPFFEKLPGWFPGAWFVKYIQDTKPFLHHMIDHPVTVVQKEMAAGTAQPSFVSNHLEELSREGQLNKQTRHDVRMLAHQILGGGSETSWHTIMLFVACMLVNPDIQRKGQAEVDRVIGHGRLPDFTDRDSLPYIECIVQETMRWNPVLPLSVPHKSVAGDVYRGMYIPKEATIIANSKSIAWDKANFHQPHLFKPDRFLPKPEGAGEVFPNSAVFGWGRRICPGRFLADNTVWLAVARILAVFDIVKAKDAAGNEIEPELKFITSVSSHPAPFAYDIKPRSVGAAELIRQAYELTQPATEKKSS